MGSESSALKPRLGETLDAVAGIQLLQSANGYRFNLDPVLLAHFAAARATLREGLRVDLGTGIGIIPILLAKTFGLPTQGLEVQPSLMELAQRNVRLNGCEDQVTLVSGDWRQSAEYFAPGSFAQVLANPPYRAAEAGRLNPHPEKALARHELAGGLGDLADAVRYLLEPGGTFSLIYPAGRLTELMSCLAQRGLQPKELRLVHPRADEPAKLLLMHAVKGARPGLVIHAPLTLHAGADGGFAPAVAAMLQGTSV